MGIADEKLDAAGETEPKVKLCANCHERPAGFGPFKHYCEECRDAGAGRRKPPVEPPEPPPARPRKAGPSPRSSAGKLHAKLRDAHYAASVGIVLATNIQALSIPGVSDVLEAKSDSWAAAAVALAEEDARVAEVIEKLLRGSVWASFVIQTVGSVVTVGVVSGRLRVPMPVAQMVAPDLVAVMVQQAAAGNGQGAA